MNAFKNMLVTLANRAGFHSVAQSQAALRNLIVATGGDINKLAATAAEVVDGKLQHACSQRQEATATIDRARAAYQAEQNKADNMVATARQEEQQAALVSASMRVMGLTLTPDADNKELAKVK